MSRGRIFCLFLVALAFPFTTPAQFSSGTQYSPQRGSNQPRQRPPLTGNITLSGMVVNAVTGEPIPRAVIQMSGQVQRAAMTDAEGRFQFENLPESRAILTARKPGFFSDMELRPGSRQVRQMAITANMGSVTVKLTPAAVVTGRITTADGEPVESARVRLKMRAIQNGRVHWNERNGASTDDDGVFRIGNLPPGIYYLYADGAGRMFNVGDEVIVPAYYPGVSEITGASPLEMRSGSTTVADFILRKEKGYRVAGVVTGLPPGQNASLQVIGPGGEFLPIGGMVNSALGTFEVRRLPAGSYNLKVMTQQRGLGPLAGVLSGTAPQRPQNYTGSVTVAVNGDVSDVAIALQPSTTIPVIVRSEFSGPQPQHRSVVTYSDGRAVRTSNQQFQLILNHVDGARGSAIMQMDGASENPSLAVQNVEPGRYRAQFTPMGNSMYVQSARYGTTDILREDLVVNGGEMQPIEVVLRDDAASLSGTVNCDGCWVVVVADGNSVAQPRMTSVNLQGGFQQLGLAPGSYRVYAFDRIDGLEFANPEAMKTYGARGESVVLSAGQKTQVAVELTRVTDQ